MIEEGSTTRLTLSTLHARSASHLIIIVLVHSLSTALLPVRRLLQENFLNLVLGRDLADGFPRRKCLFERSHLFGGQAIGELDGQLDVEVAVLVVSMRRHTLTLNDLEHAFGDNNRQYEIRKSQRRTYLA